MQYKTIDEKITKEIVEKKSKFICNLYPVESKEEAEKIIRETKKQYYDARHNCYAYVIYDINTEATITKSSDDGEPSGTAGAPILNILNGQNLVNILVIVTRYFGGILLGTGGLVRAYTESTQKAIEESKTYNVENGYIANIEIEYNQNEEFNYFCKKNKIRIIKTEYLNNIKYNIEISEKNKIKILEKYDNKKGEKTSLDIIKPKMIKIAEL